MLTLYLVRHAKAEPLAETDNARELADQGIKDAKNLGKLFGHMLVQPDTVYCSTAKRTKQTLSLMQEAGLSCGDIHYDDDIYHASADLIIEKLQKAETKNVMIIGHNPAMAILLNRLADEQDVAPSMLHFPTGSLAQIHFSGDKFQDLEFQASGKVVSFLKGADI